MNRLLFVGFCKRDAELNSYIYIISFGGNLGEREKTARETLQILSGFGSVGRQSRWLYTQPLPSQEFDMAEHGEYLNFVFEFSTSLAPNELYAKVRTIEDHFGRDRSRRWLPRAADLDLLLCARANKDTELFEPENAFSYRDPSSDLQIPHGELGKRTFLLDMITADLALNVVGLLTRHE